MTEGASGTRPLSPHIQAWRWTVTMASSITHRATGIALYSGTLLLALWLFTLSFNPATFERLSEIFTSPLGIFVLGGYVWALMFHMLNGIRHLYWDSGRGLDYDTAKKMAWVIFAASFILTIIIVWAGLAAREAV